jgi:Glycolipid 2-alpha-mannosyltransferase
MNFWPSMNGTGAWNQKSSISVILHSMLHRPIYPTGLTRCSDPFLRMIEANKTYGFTIAVKELKETVPNIFRYASAYKRVNNLTSQGLWEMFVEPQPEKPEELPEDDPNYKHPLPEEILRGDPSRASLPTIDPEAMEGEKYNMCHFWSNFEIARLSWFRSKEYEDFFQMMDRSGGFWMERVSRYFVPDACLVLMYNSGEMLRSTPSQLERFSLLETSITSVTLATDIPQSNIVLRMHQLAKCHDLHS